MAEDDGEWHDFSVSTPIEIFSSAIEKTLVKTWGVGGARSSHELADVLAALPSDDDGIIRCSESFTLHGREYALQLLLPSSRHPMLSSFGFDDQACCLLVPGVDYVIENESVATQVLSALHGGFVQANCRLLHCVALGDAWRMRFVGMQIGDGEYVRVERIACVGGDRWGLPEAVGVHRRLLGTDDADAELTAEYTYRTRERRDDGTWFSDDEDSTLHWGSLDDPVACIGLRVHSCAQLAAPFAAAALCNDVLHVGGGDRPSEARRLAAVDCDQWTVWVEPSKTATAILAENVRECLVAAVRATDVGSWGKLYVSSVDDKKSDTSASSTSASGAGRSLEGALEGLTRRDEIVTDVVSSVVAAATRLHLDPLPSSIMLSKLIESIFDSGAADDDGGGGDDRSLREEMRTVPRGSLLSRFVTIGLVHMGNLRSIGLLWRAFVDELRWHWDQGVDIAHVGAQLYGEKDATWACDLHKEIALLQYCIEERRRVSRDDDERAPLAAAAESAPVDVEEGGVGDLDDSFEAAGDDGWGIEDIDVPTQPARSKTSAAARTSTQDDGLGRAERTGLSLVGDESAPLYAPRLLASPPRTRRTMDDRALTQRKQGEARLKADMSAFKCANPAASFEDFVRWHSPKDWVESERALSSRMKDADNVWHTLWRQAEAQRADEQPSSVAYVVEANKALHYLETAPPAAIVSQLCALLLCEVPVVVVGSLTRQQRKVLRCSESDASVRRALLEFRQRHLQGDEPSLSALTIEELDALVGDVRRYEMRYATRLRLSLLSLPPTLLQRLLDFEPVLLDGGERRGAERHAMAVLLHNELEGAPHERKLLLRSRIRLPHWDDCDDEEAREQRTLAEICENGCQVATVSRVAEETSA